MPSLFLGAAVQPAGWPHKHSAGVAHGIEHHKNAAKTQTIANSGGSVVGDPLSSSIDHGESIHVIKKSCL